MESVDSRGQLELAESTCCPGQEARETGAPLEMSDQEGAERGFHSLARYDQGDDSQP